MLLGTGTSITQAAVRELARAGVLLGFCGGAGTPLFAGMEQTLEVAWLPGQSEYRPTEYLQQWVGSWSIGIAADGTTLLTQEARLTKQLYRLASQVTSYGEFTRAKQGESQDAANQFLDHGNYLAYGLGATTLWVLGIPHALAVLHGKTRRGGLVFDVADLVKDAVILPQAFLSAARGHTEQRSSARLALRR